jgi:hypothetical protein
MARGIVLAKTLNQRTVLRRALRDHDDGMAEDAKAAVVATEGRQAPAKGEGAPLTVMRRPVVPATVS